ncbi:hypothetical protein T01_6284 [Trichinella spiralis]|uniref:Uncharacterized protein n=1 Tax=Trichinella spiralis TaxID=6334 RepID=A0A0V1B8S1_TRISP|nr:hypothetical protein T01_6284 [Trichinella spiralis]
MSNGKNGNEMKSVVGSVEEALIAYYYGWAKIVEQQHKEHGQLCENEKFCTAGTNNDKSQPPEGINLNYENIRASLWNINIVRIVQFVHPESSSPPILQARFWDKFIHNPPASAPSPRQVGAEPAPSAAAARPYNKSTNNGAEKSQPNGGTGHR